MTPERIWVTWPTLNGTGLAFTVPGDADQRYGYIRADTVQALIAAEREACAAECDRIDNQCGMEAGLGAACAATIRERGSK